MFTVRYCNGFTPRSRSASLVCTCRGPPAPHRPGGATLFLWCVRVAAARKFSAVKIEPDMSTARPPRRPRGRGRASPSHTMPRPYHCMSKRPPDKRSKGYPVNKLRLETNKFDLTSWPLEPVCPGWKIHQLTLHPQRSLSCSRHEESSGTAGCCPAQYL